MIRKVQSLGLRKASHIYSCTKHMQAPCTAGQKWGLNRRGRLLWLWPEFLPHFLASLWIEIRWEGQIPKLPSQVGCD